MTVGRRAFYPDADFKKVLEKNSRSVKKIERARRRFCGRSMASGSAFKFSIAYFRILFFYIIKFACILLFFNTSSSRARFILNARPSRQPAHCTIRVSCTAEVLFSVLANRLHRRRRRRNASTPVQPVTLSPHRRVFRQPIRM